MTIFQKIIKLPYKAKAICVKNDDNSVTIFLNNIFTFEQLQKSYLHEIEHIKNNDFEKTNVNEIELNAHVLK
jgi:hypothetical protein